MEVLGQNIIQKGLCIIQCDRWGTNFSRLTHLRRHFNNKNIWKPVLQDTPIKELIEKSKKYKFNKRFRTTSKRVIIRDIYNNTN